jgi:hypothetical protein
MPAEGCKDPSSSIFEPCSQVEQTLGALTEAMTKQQAALEALQADIAAGPATSQGRPPAAEATASTQPAQQETPSKPAEPTTQQSATGAGAANKPPAGADEPAEAAAATSVVSAPDEKGAAGPVVKREPQQLCVCLAQQQVPDPDNMLQCTCCHDW